jgi:S-adenosylmethionine hydrolase
VDLTHEVPPQDVRSGAYQLWAAVEVFPPGTVHLAIVDPGVGTSRRALALATARGDLLVGPDNGLLLRAAKRLGGVARAVELSNPRFFRPEVARTFHGRDLFAPAAAHLLAGEPLEALGGAAAELVEAVVFPDPRSAKGAILGEILHVDRYGNLVTNLPRAALPERFSVRVGRARIRSAPHASYQAVARGGLVALFGSAGTLEISVRDGDAARKLKARVGQRVRVEAIP